MATLLPLCPDYLPRLFLQLPGIRKPGHPPACPSKIVILSLSLSLHSCTRERSELRTRASVFTRMLGQRPRNLRIKLQSVCFWPTAQIAFFPAQKCDTRGVTLLNIPTTYFPSLHVALTGPRRDAPDSLRRRERALPCIRERKAPIQSRSYVCVWMRRERATMFRVKIFIRDFVLASAISSMRIDRNAASVPDYSHCQR